MTTDLEFPPGSRIAPFEVRGGNSELLGARDDEILCEGPAGTGKTHTCLSLLNILCHTYAGLQVLMLRKVGASMATSCIKEFKLHVLKPGDGTYYFGGSTAEPAAFRYHNGSQIVVGGIDNAQKVLSSFYDVIYVNEATELTEDDWETLTGRLRGGKPEDDPISADGVRFTARRIIADCNPTFRQHWLMQRTDQGKTRLITTRLEDNPAYFTPDGQPTEEGARYIARLERMTGIRYQRFRLGLRVGMQDSIYANFDRTTHIRPLEDGLYFLTTIIGVDYGRNHECAVVVLSIDQYRRRWVREVWTKVDTDQGRSLNRIVGMFRDKYKTRRGRVDPNQGYLAGRLGFGIAKGGSGGAAGPPRMHRIDLLEPLWYTFPGGRVPSFRDDILNMPVDGPYAEPDSPGILLVEGAPGIDKMADELEQYRFVWLEQIKGGNTVRTKEVLRVNENTIAALEYANEEYEEGDEPIVQGTVTIQPLMPPQATQQAARTVRQVGTRGFNNGN